MSLELTPAQIILTMAQRTELKLLVVNEYERLCRNEAAAIAPYVTEFDRVLDVGAGLGGYWAFLPKPKAIDFLDIDHFERLPGYGFITDGHQEAYNLNSETRDFLNTHAPGTLRDQYTPANPPSGPYDIVVSLLSWGYHYPWTTYADLAHEILVANGLLILDVRKIAIPAVQADARFAVKDILKDSLKSQRLLLQRLST